MAVSPVRCVRLGAPVEAVATLYGMSVEALEAEMQAAEDKTNSEDARRQAAPVSARPGKLMTVLLVREDVPAWQFRQTRKQAR